jgi:hypothetical protein
MKREKTRKRKNILITTPFPTVEEVAKICHVSKKRIEEIEKICEEVAKKRKKQSGGC